MSDLKRETLAYVQGGPSGGQGAGAGRPSNSAPTARARRRRTEDAEMEYVVHRDAGRLERPRPNVLELPPRYEEVNWDEGEREDREPREAQDRTT